MAHPMEADGWKVSTMGRESIRQRRVLGMKDNGVKVCTRVEECFGGLMGAGTKICVWLVNKMGRGDSSLKMRKFIKIGLMEEYLLTELLLWVFLFS